MSQRGKSILRRLDATLGPLLIGAVGSLVRLRSAVSRGRHTEGITLIVCFGAIGDVLLLSAVAKRALPDRKLVLACTDDNKVAASVFPDLYDQVVPLQIGRPWALLRAFWGQSVREVFDSTQWANVSALQLGLLRTAKPWASTKGFESSTRSRRGIYHELTQHSSEVHEVVNFARLLGMPDLDPDTLVPHRAPVGRKVALHLWPSGTRSYLKEWPRSHWVEVARALHDRGCELFVTGGPDDLARNDVFIRECRVPVANLAGITSLSQLYAMFQTEIALCISVNTGTMHLAALAGTGVIALNGPTNPDRWSPVGPHAVSLLPSSGNFAYLNYGFEYPADDKDAYALDRLSVEKVVDQSLRLLPK